MSTMTTQPVRVGWGPRIEVLAGAGAMAIGTVAALPHYGGLVPLALGCFMGVASPVAFRQVDRFRAACAIVGGCLLFASIAGFGVLSLYFLFYTPPLVVAAMAVFAADATARARQRGEPADQPVPISARIMLVLVAISAGCGLHVAATLPQPPTAPIGTVGWAALALLPVAIPGRRWVRLAGIVGGFGLLLVCLRTGYWTLPVLAAGVAEVIVCCDESRRGWLLALVAVVVPWFSLLLAFA